MDPKSGVALRLLYRSKVVVADHGFAQTAAQKSVTTGSTARRSSGSRALHLDARFVSSDPAVEQNMVNDLLAHAHGAANKFLESYFHADDFAKNPFQLMKHQTVSVQIESILQASPKSYEVRWSETALDMSGAPLGTNHWEAILETELSPQNSTDTVISNPLGFYVTRLSWAEQQS
jgi:type IV secretory pathway TrbF-like protein